MTPSSLLLTERRHWAIAIGLLAETFFVLIIGLLQAMLDAETDFSQSGHVANLAGLKGLSYNGKRGGMDMLHCPSRSFYILMTRYYLLPLKER